ncbi:mannan endo-1,4-beta-mannosidase [Actinoplanes regularis]|uniref:Endoglucanase n=2 Tax=Actinoplanes regularis TaxID=52697 RepID=A0A239J3U3_9ACTN|nr:hypothetical protein Are01nite_62010 [Actinoplanes regularis]SNT00342.1 mannan endo-1,4-beta-mannosidase [Actinoplanes regularis]
MKIRSISPDPGGPDTVRFGTDRDGYQAILAAGRKHTDRIWAVEGCSGIGRHVAQRLVADGETVLDVPAKLSARARVFSTGQDRETDPVDAHSVAVVALRRFRRHLIRPPPGWLYPSWRRVRSGEAKYRGDYLDQTKKHPEPYGSAPERPPSIPRKGRGPMRRFLVALGAALLAATGAVVALGSPAYAATGLHVVGTDIYEANGSKFIMRGVNHAHTWYTNQTSSFANIKAAGANTVRVVLSGGRWTANSASDVANVISLCKANKLICVLEDHDTTGYGEDSAAYTLDQAVNYWISLKSVLVGQEDYISINIGNEPIGNTNPSQWTAATTAAIKKMRDNGFQHLLMIDAPNWGQDWQTVMRDNAQTVLDADAQHNTILSIHMYSVYAQASTITAYLDAFKAKGWPLLIGEFGWQFDSSQVADQTVIAEAVSRGLGYLGWSWSGNTDPILDMVLSFDTNQKTTWYNRVFGGANGITATAKQATIFGTSTSSPTVSPSQSSSSPSPSPSSSSPSTGKTCTAAYSIAGQWPGGFQGEVKVTAGSSAISGWTVTWTYANGQTVANAWSATVTSSGSSVTARNVSYNGSVGAGASTSFGFLGSWTGTNSVPAVTCTAT